MTIDDYIVSDFATASDFLSFLLVFSSHFSSFHGKNSIANDDYLSDNFEVFMCF